MILVEAPGFLTTVQDLGRPGYAHLGISASGAADTLSLRAGNRLVGNPDDAAVLEMTLVGGTFAFETDALAALTGSDFGATHPLWTPFPVKPGEIVRCGATRGGARCYLCVRGGIAVPLVLGSASTHLMSGIGGFEGRALRRGDRLWIAPASGPPARRGVHPPPSVSGALRVTPGPQAGWFSQRFFDAFYASEWEVSEESNRMGLRLRGPVLESPAGRMLTEGVPLGAIQVPPGGQPIVLFVEHQTTGGYPKIANVIAADLHRVGQLRPRDRVRFEQVSLDRAIAVLGEQEAWLDGLL